MLLRRSDRALPHLQKQQPRNLLRNMEIVAMEHLHDFSLHDTVVTHAKGFCANRCSE